MTYNILTRRGKFEHGHTLGERPVQMKAEIDVSSEARKEKGTTFSLRALRKNQPC